MRYIVIVFIFLFNTSIFCQSDYQRYPQHFAAGMIIGGGTSYLVYKKTNNKVKSWAIGTGAATILGLAKELIDPEIDAADLGYTALGGAIGASIVFPLKKKKPKEVAYLF